MKNKLVRGISNSFLVLLLLLIIKVNFGIGNNNFYYPGTNCIDHNYSKLNIDTNKIFNSYLKNYVNDNKLTIDSLQEWVDLNNKRGGINTEIEINSLIDMCGKYFFRQPYNSISSIVLNKILERPFDSEKNLNKWSELIARYFLNYKSKNNWETHSVEKAICEESTEIRFNIWGNDFDFEFINLPIIKDSVSVNGIEVHEIRPSPKLLSEINKTITEINNLKTDWTGMSLESYSYGIEPKIDTIEYTAILKTILNKLNITAFEKCQLLYILSIHLCKMGVNEEVPKVLKQIVNILDKSFDYTIVEDNIIRGKYYLGVAKMYSTIGFEKYNLEILRYLKRAEHQFSRKRSLDSDTYLKQVQLLISIVWSMMPGIEARITSIDNIFENFRLGSDNINNDVYSILTICESEYLKEEYYINNSNIQPEQFSQINLQTLIAIKGLPENNQLLKARTLISLGNCYGIKQDWKVKLKLDMYALDLVLEGKQTTTTFNLLLKLIREIGKDESNLRKEQRAFIWLKTIKDYYPLLNDQLITDYRLWSKKEYEKFRDSYLIKSSPYDLETKILFFQYFDAHENTLYYRRILEFSSELESREGRWKNAYILKDKKDLIDISTNPSFAYKLGWMSKESKDTIEYLDIQNKLVGTSNSLEYNQLQLARIKHKMELSQKRIDYLDHSIINKEIDLREKKIALNSLSTKYDSLNTFYGTRLQIIENLEASNKRAEEQKKRANKQAEIAQHQTNIANTEKEKANLNMWLAILAGISAIILAIISVRARQKSKREAMINKYKSSIWQEFGHIPSSAISYSYNKLRSMNIEKSSLVSLDCLEKFLSNMFTSLRNTDFKTINNLESEVNLAKEYVNYTNITGDKKISFEVSNELPQLSLPPAIILSCVKNAIMHGGMIIKGIGRIGIKIEIKEDKYNCEIYDDGIGFPLEIEGINDIKTGTGLNNANGILNYFNRSIKNDRFIRFASTKENGFTNKVILTIKK